MLIQYNGPRQTIQVAPFGAHALGERKEYPDDFGADLIKTSKRQRFVRVLEPKKAKAKRNALRNTKRPTGANKQR